MSITDAPAKDLVSSTKGLSFPSIKASSKATTLLGSATATGGAAGGGGGGGGGGVATD